MYYDPISSQLALCLDGLTHVYIAYMDSSQ